MRHNLLLFLLLLCFLAGCAGTSHTFGLATMDDINAEREDQRQVDHAIIDGSVADTGVANQLHAVVDEAAKRSRGRLLPASQGGSGIDWTQVILGVLGLAGLGVGVTAHVKGSATQKSLDATDKWVQQTENDVKANVATVARVAPKVNVVPIDPVIVQPTGT